MPTKTSKLKNGKKNKINTTTPPLSSLLPNKPSNQPLKLHSFKRNYPPTYLLKYLPLYIKKEKLISKENHGTQS